MTYCERANVDPSPSGHQLMQDERARATRIPRKKAGETSKRRIILSRDQRSQRLSATFVRTPAASEKDLPSLWDALNAWLFAGCPKTIANSDLAFV
ncbi:hypothetical protein VTO73DRAFT_8848 [Trametes versicolor]